MIFFTADLHGYHPNIMKYCRRPGLTPEELEKLDKGIKFKPCEESVQRMNDYILGNINSTVAANDTLYILGDFIFAPKHLYPQWVKAFRSGINCRNVFLVAGNHDVVFPEVVPLFRSIRDLMTVYVGNKTFVLCHYAMAVWNKSHRGAYHLYGHSHGSAEQWLDKIMPTRKSMDVGIDNAANVLPGLSGVQGQDAYRPFSMDEIVLRMSQKFTADPATVAKLSPLQHEDE